MILLVWSLTAGNAGAADNPESEPAVAFAARLVGDENRSRLVMDFKGKISFKTFYLQNPNRIIIDLPATIFGFEKISKLPKSALIPEFRYGIIAPGRSRIVMTARGPALIEKAEVVPLEQTDQYRLIVDLVKTDSKSLQSVLFRQNSAEVLTGAVAFKGDRVRPGRRNTDKFLIVIDPGHGGIDGGAEGGKRVAEKIITLSFARYLQKTLEDTGLFKVVMTRNADVFVPLGERSAIARRYKADMFLSIHADSFSLNGVRGATIYTLSKTGSDDLSQLLAEKENRSDLIAGLSLPKENSLVTDILIDLTRRETQVFSKRIAETMVERLRGGIALIKNPHRSANFRVLRAPEVPSVLLELGYLSNSKDEQLMQETTWQKNTAERIADALRSFFRQRWVQKQ